MNYYITPRPSVTLLRLFLLNYVYYVRTATYTAATVAAILTVRFFIFHRRRNSNTTHYRQQQEKEEEVDPVVHTVTEQLLRL